ncbi:unnamed protein product [Rotaria sp. Silwood2]|nr:unnamed protein product [Rotaria sp. Silwood2]
MNDAEDENLIDVSLDSSSTISSWLIDYYFTKTYLSQVKISNKSIQPNIIIGLHDMFIIYQIIQTTSTSKEFFELCKKKFQHIKDDLILDNYNNYLNRCGLKDIIDLFHQCKLKSFIKKFIFNINNNYIKHTICTYLALLLDTRNEHALIHCLATPARAGIERRTIVELRRLSKLSKNECLTIYQILISFLRRKELILSRLSSSQQDSINTDDESFIILDKYYTGIKDFFDFIEQIQMTIEENEHLKIESIVTFRKIMTHMSKQLRKDSSFSRCDSIFKEIIEEFSQCFQTTLPLMDCASPIRVRLKLDYQYKYTKHS